MREPASLGFKFLVFCLFACGLGAGAIVVVDANAPLNVPTTANAMAEPVAVAKIDPSKQDAEKRMKPEKPKPAKPKLAGDVPTGKAQPTIPGVGAMKPEPKPEQKPKSVEVAAKISFQADVLPIFKAKCTTCHGDTGAKGGVDLRTLRDAVGFAVIPGNLKDSIVWQTISEGSMPPSGKEKLTAAEKKTIGEWIASGAK